MRRDFGVGERETLGDVFIREVINVAVSPLAASRKGR